MGGPESEKTLKDRQFWLGVAYATKAGSVA